MGERLDGKGAVCRAGLRRTVEREKNNRQRQPKNRVEIYLRRDAGEERRTKTHGVASSNCVWPIKLDFSIGEFCVSLRMSVFVKRLSGGFQIADLPAAVFRNDAIASRAVNRKSGQQT